jgi:hypothetical protein
MIANHDFGSVGPRALRVWMIAQVAKIEDGKMTSRET